jgi:uncharacterized integral membrane protein (TIGR00697 family)
MSQSSPAPVLTGLAVVVISVYAVTQLLADLASLKIGVVFGLAVDLGTFIYPITFTLRDLAHKILGRRQARIMIIAAAFINLFAVLCLIGAALVPSDEGWGLGEEYSAIFTPIWRIVFASVVAQVVSQLVNTEVYHWFATRVTRRHQWLRVLISNTISIPIDNLIFVLGAFALAMPWSTVGEIFIFNLVLKWIVMLVSIPLVYTTKADHL